MLEVVLWTSLAMLAYIYAGYAVMVVVLGRVFRRPVACGPELPRMTMIISAYNEEKHIADKIQNVLSLDYPRDRLEVIVASDASNDATDQIVRRHEPEVKLLRIEGRLGKTACQNVAAEVASGDVLIFTDATTMVTPESLRAIARNFADPEVGCVAGRLTYYSPNESTTGQGGRSYWGYESMVRQAESSLGSLIGVSGQLYAVRRSAYRPIPADLISDFVIAMVIREQGLRTVLEPNARCFEETLDRAGSEISMRVRVTLRSLFAIATLRRFLNPFRFGAFAWQLWSHKLLRYLSPVFLASAFIANVALALQGHYVPLLVVQLAAISVALLGFLQLRSFTKFRLLAQPYYFLLTNISSAISLIRFVRGEKVVTWTPVR
jgi:cellulose synthase/poly-beta-1,6-N-acetylglucosamine synthase-like glycosyltransferase